MKIILSDSTEIDDLVLNGNNYVSETEVTEDMFTGNLDTVTIEDGDNTTVLTNCKLVQIAHYSDGYYFILEEMTEAEINANSVEAQTLYTALMTDTLLEE